MPLCVLAAMFTVRSHHLSKQLLGRNLLFLVLCIVRFQDFLVLLLVSNFHQNWGRNSLETFVLLSSFVIVDQLLLNFICTLLDNLVANDLFLKFLELFI